MTNRLKSDGFDASIYLHSTSQALHRSDWIEMELKRGCHFVIACTGHSNRLSHSQTQLSFANEMGAEPGKVILLLIEACDVSQMPKFLQNLYHFPINTGSDYGELKQFLWYKLGNRTPAREVTLRSGADAMSILQPDEPSANQEDRAIIVVGKKLNGSIALAFEEGETYRLFFSVGPPSKANLASGDTSIHDIPPGGLRTRWVLTSSVVELIKAYSSASIENKESKWKAEFDLLIPERGESTSHSVAFAMGRAHGNLEVLIYSLRSDGAKELYRELSVELATKASVHRDCVTKNPSHTHLKSKQIWTQPPEHVQVAIHNGIAIVTTKEKRLNDYDFWGTFATGVSLSGAIDNLRRKLEIFRLAHDEYLNDISSDDLKKRLEWWPRPYAADWQRRQDNADPRYQETFQRVQQSSEWRNLAARGFELFNLCFPEDSDRRLMIQKLVPGSRIDFQWTEQGNFGWVSHVPWALMYMEQVERNVPVDPEKFLGLRFRIGSRAWQTKNGSLVLGDPDKTSCLHLLYWGNQPGDEVARESAWHAGEFRNWKQSKLCPNSKEPNLKAQLLDAVDSPGVGVLYFYCHCSVGDGSEPFLRFGNTPTAEDTIRQDDWSQSKINGGPLIFANACTTAHADPHMTSWLEKSFFDKGARAFIGTETKVPITLASKFGWLYLQLFVGRKLGRNPLSAGEALTQARRFLWTEYKNVGGLFYGITNQYDLFLGTEAEVLAMRELA